MDYNPVTHPFCKDCPHYKPVGTYISELNRPGEEGRRNRKCRNLAICFRVSKMEYQQLSLFN